MTVELDKTDLLALINGKEPYYKAFDVEIIKENGSYCGGFVDKWRWDPIALQRLSEKELYELYTICKNSWK